jgi:hypothetical protein
MLLSMFFQMFDGPLPDGSAYRGLPFPCLKLGPISEKERAWRFDWIGGLINTMFWGIVFCPVPIVWRGIRIRRLERRLFEGRCLWCGYNLRGIAENRCPECGKPFDPKLLYINSVYK